MWYHLKDNFSLMLMVPVTQKRKFFTKLISGYPNLPLISCDYKFHLDWFILS